LQSGGRNGNNGLSSVEATTTTGALARTRLLVKIIPEVKLLVPFLISYYLVSKLMDFHAFQQKNTVH